jgi:hypothetical protein
MTKAFYLSKTFWFNAAAIFVAAVDSTDVLNVVPDVAEPFLIAAVAVVNIVLRVVTAGGLTLQAPKE